MNARLMTVCAICGFALAVLIASPGSSAPSASGHGLFSGLKVGQMVDLTKDGIWAVVRTYDDPEGKQLNCTITEIGNDFIAFELESKDTGTSAEIRVPVYNFAAVQHVGKAGPKRPATKKKN